MTAGTENMVLIQRPDKINKMVLRKLIEAKQSIWYRNYYLLQYYTLETVAYLHCTAIGMWGRGRGNMRISSFKTSKIITKALIHHEANAICTIHISYVPATFTRSQRQLPHWSIIIPTQRLSLSHERYDSYLSSACLVHFALDIRICRSSLWQVAIS